MNRILFTLTLILTSILHTDTPVHAYPKTQGTCSNDLFDAAAAYAGWPVDEIPKVGRIAYRESRCQPGARNSCCHGLMQVHRAWLRRFGLTQAEARDGFTNLWLAHEVWLVSGWTAWSR